MKKEFAKSTKAWLRTQDISIKSCDINIAYYKTCISNFRASIIAEKAERKAKVEMRAKVLKNLKQTLSK